MRKKYRIKTEIGPDFNTPMFNVQVKTWIGNWITIKSFYNPYDVDFARLEADELIEKLEE